MEAQAMSERSAWVARMSTTPSQETLARLWEDHIRHEFETRSTEDTLATMVEDAYVDHVPVLTGGSGKAELREFYATHFIPRMPPDMEMVPISRTIGSDQLVDEMVIKFTHSVELDWMHPKRRSDRDGPSELYGRLGTRDWCMSGLKSGFQTRCPRSVQKIKDTWL